MPPSSWFPRALLLALLALLLTACGALTSHTGGHDQLHASCYQLLTGQAATLTPAAFSAADVATPAPSPEPKAPTRRWSDASAWPGGALPTEGDAVTIQAGEVVLLDVSPPQLGLLLIEGDLVFGRQELELAAAAIEVRGGLYVGSATQPFTDKAIIRVGGEVPAGAPDCFGSNYLGLVNGTLELYGDAQGPAWTRLSATAPAGATSIQVDDAAGFAEGDRIVIAYTDFFSWGADAGNEERTLTRVEGSTLYFARPLRYQHYGSDQRFGAATGLPTTLLESRAEVARLTRNVRVTGQEFSAQQDSGRWGEGAHIMALGNSRVRLDSVELTAMGQAGQLMRYPVHFHLQGDAAYGSFVRNSSLHHLYNRCITIHGSRGVLLQGNAAFDTFGHCYFFEDGAETGNVLLGNLGILAREPEAGNRLIPTDAGGLGPSIFWVTNPDNVLVGNVAASSEGSGFWYSLPEHPTGPSFDLFDGGQIWPRRTPLGQFKDNLAHSNASDGLHVDRGPAAGTLQAETTAYRPRAVPANLDSAPVPASFENFVAYKHRQDAAWFRGDATFLTGALLVDNAVGVTFASNASGMLNSVVVGESANNPGQPPRTWAPDFAVRGFQFYDGAVHVADSHFEGFTGRAAALSINDFTSFSLSSRSYASGLTFAPGTNRVTFTKPDDLQRNDESGADGYSSGLFIDLDGSVTGSRGVSVTVDNKLLERAGCTAQADWNAQLCPGPYSALTLRNLDANPRELAPVTLTRSTGDAHTLYGTPRTGANTHFRSLVPLGYAYSYDFAPATPANFTLELSEAAPADTLLVSVPYAGAAPFIYRDWWIDPRSLLESYPSLAALTAAEGSTGYYYQEGQRLYLKLAVQPQRDWAHLTVCRRAGC